MGMINMDWMGNIWWGNPKRESCQGEGTHHQQQPATRLGFSLQKTRTAFPIQTQPKEREMQQNTANVAQHGKHPKASPQRDAWLGRALLAVENSRQEILQCFKHHCIPPSSDTDIHPGNTDKTSCHRAGWQLKVDWKHLSAPHLKQKDGTNHHFCVFLLQKPQFFSP